MFGRPVSNYKTTRSLFKPANDYIVRDILQLDIGLTQNVIDFLEYIKIIFEQKGYVATGLRASVMVARKAVHFRSGPAPEVLPHTEPDY
jgi:hypothetical protein